MIIIKSIKIKITITATVIVVIAAIIAVTTAKDWNVFSWMSSAHYLY